MAITWAQRLKRVFNIEVETCRVCGGAAKVAVPAHPCAHGICASLHIIACIENPAVIRKILNHLQEQLPRVSAGLGTAIGGKTGKRGRVFRAVRSHLEKIPAARAEKWT